MLKTIDDIILYSYTKDMNNIVKINPHFNSELTTVLFDLERLRYQQLEGTITPWLFFDLKEIVHLVESVASARIEGNRTTVIGAANDIIENQQETNNESVKELRNIRRGIEFIETHLKDKGKISEGFIRELHKIAIKELSDDGSKTPGKFRTEDVKISKSAHKPPSHLEVPSLMQELVEYINEPLDSKFDILKTATAHHRFAAIHPFDNGNGRTARLLTYAMLAEQRFIDDQGFRLLNPASIFCIDREEYFRQLANADKSTPSGMEEWCLYVAKGIQQEAARITRLLDKKFAVTKLIAPALKNARVNKYISESEHEILQIAMEKDVFQARDVKHLFGTSASATVQTSRVLTGMKRKGLIMALPNNKKKYAMRFANNHLLRDVLSGMDDNGLLPITNNTKD